MLVAIPAYILYNFSSQPNQLGQAIYDAFISPETHA